MGSSIVWRERSAPRTHIPGNQDQLSQAVSLNKPPPLSVRTKIDSGSGGDWTPEALKDLDEEERKEKVSSSAGSECDANFFKYFITSIT